METIPDTAPAETGATASGKADLGKRFGAALIDGLIAYALALLLSFGGRGTLYGFGMLVGAGYFLFRDGLALEFMNGRSVGKKLMKLRPVRLDGGVMDINASVRRNWPLALGYILWGVASLAAGLGMLGLLAFLGILAWIGSLLALVEAILVLTDADGRRFGDKFANTQVVASDD